jgi:hypothetical protein
VQLPFDLLRLLLEETARGALPPEDPEIVRFVAGIGWRVERALTPRRDLITRDQARRTFGVTVRTAEAIAREAHDLGLQARLESGEEEEEDGWGSDSGGEEAKGGGGEPAAQS